MAKVTRDELMEFLNGSLVPRLEQAWRDLDASKVREEAHLRDIEREREVRKRAEKASDDKDAVIAAKDRILAAKNAEIDMLK